MHQKKIRLGKGEFEHIHRDGLSISIKDARDYFLDAIKEVAPEVLEDLADQPFKMYKAAGLALDREFYREKYKDLEYFDQIRAMSKIEFQHTFNHPDWKTQFENIEVNYDKNTAIMQKSIFDWSKRHNLDVAWCRARAYETIDYWHRFIHLYEARIWNWDRAMEKVLAGFTPAFNFKIESTYPVFSFRSDEKEKIRKAFELELDAFLDERERIAKENGMVNPKQKREYQHFVWFAYYQVKEWTQRDIQEEFNVTREAVKTALGSIRNLLKTPNDNKSELKRAVIKVGRPRKN